ncbi:basic 7S globulin-like [Papaver somniferum]|uniref:basic 7S globulin-like n=1 Tax=Papaver somniferum TaxID=3469 RepID=UPI000E6F7249|nr:basic 7S globulin-like [Papaver somniferum]
MKSCFSDRHTDQSVALFLGGKLSWLSCCKGYSSSSYRPVSCRSPQCALANKPVISTRELCNGTAKNACSIYINNPVTRSVGKGELISDLLNVTSNPDSHETPVTSPRRCSFGSASTAGNILNRLAKTSKGSSSVLSLLPQHAVSFRFSRIFALDLHEPVTNEKTSETRGKIYFGGGPYLHYMSDVEDFVDRVLTYAPLLINPKGKEEYFVDLRSMKVHGITVPINRKLLSINKKTGVGGTKIDIRIPYTTMETSIYKAFTKTYAEWVERYNANSSTSLNISMVTPVAPFTTSFNSSTVPMVNMFHRTETPSVSFIFPKSVWNIVLFDLVRVSDGVDCVGFVDGGSKPTTSIVIGARQIGFLQFDISGSKLGFGEPYIHEFMQRTSSLLVTWFISFFNKIISSFDPKFKKKLDKIFLERASHT